VDILIIGGTRNLGHLLTLHLLAAGHQVTIFNRGQTPDELPDSVQRLHGDRSDPNQLKQALAGRSFDAVVDTTLYNGSDAQAIVDLLKGRVGKYIFLSSGQVYLVCLGLKRPFKEADYARSEVMSAPPSNTHDYKEWLYGVEKRAAEDILTAAKERYQFPFVSLRLPMVNSERDHFNRIYGYFLRLQDGGPILIPAGSGLPVRHIYGGDVIKAITIVLESGVGLGQAYNISQDETLALKEFLSLLSELAGYSLQVAPINRGLLETNHLLPAWSPFSDPWMSELDNQRSKAELGMVYTPVRLYLEKLVAYYRTAQLPIPANYQRRSEELKLAADQGSDVEC
jgi:nucleoside-diphosphate-sugar epimerase